MIFPLTYCKFKDESRFQAYDINSGLPVKNLIYATMLENSKESQEKLQRLANLIKDLGLVIQLRDKNKVVFQTI